MQRADRQKKTKPRSERGKQESEERKGESEDRKGESEERKGEERQARARKGPSSPSIVGCGKDPPVPVSFPPPPLNALFRRLLVTRYSAAPS